MPGFPSGLGFPESHLPQQGLRGSGSACLGYCDCHIYFCHLFVSLSPVSTQLTFKCVCICESHTNWCCGCRGVLSKNGPNWTDGSEWLQGLWWYMIPDHQQWPQASEVLKETNQSAAECWEVGRPALGALPSCCVALAKTFSLYFHYEDRHVPRHEVCHINCITS